MVFTTSFQESKTPEVFRIMFKLIFRFYYCKIYVVSEERDQIPSGHRFFINHPFDRLIHIGKYHQILPLIDAKQSIKIHLIW